MRRKLAGLGAAVAVASGTVIVAVAGPAGAVTWTPANAPLPADAVPGQGMTLVSDACPADGWCVAVGNYPANMGFLQYTAGLIVVETGGTSSAIEAPLPANSATGDPQALISSVDCAQVGACVAVGRYLDSTGATQGLIEQLSGDVWTPMEAPVPASAITTTWVDMTSLTSVNCPSTTWCESVGVFTTSSGAQQVLAENLAWGMWWPAAVPVPASAPGSQFMSLSCPTVGWCAGTAEYPSSSGEAGLIETLAGGRWTATSLALPSSASSVASLFGTRLPISCPSAGACVVAGTVFDGTYWGLLDTLSSGTWLAAVAPLPNNITSSDVQLAAVSCADSSFCVAAGLVNAVGTDQGLVETLSSGSWGASLTPAPDGTDPSASVDLSDVNCPADSTCVADGLVAVSNAAGNSTTGEMLSLDGSGWSALAAPLPADAATNPAPAFAPLTCPAIGACAAAGTYIGASGREGIIEEDPALMPTTTSASVSQVSAQTLAFSASVSGGNGAPGGTVTFSSGAEQLCVAALSDGTATCNGPLNPTSKVLASYSGDAANAPSWGSTSDPWGPWSITAVWGTPQSVKVGKYLSQPLIAMVRNVYGTPVPGVPVTFVAPKTGSSGSFVGYTTVSTNGWGQSTAPPFKADSKAGSYTVTATAPYAWGSAQFSLTNTKL